MVTINKNIKKLTLEQILSQVENLPETSKVAVKVSKMLDDFNVDINHLAQTVTLDQALTAQLLKLCNSAHYGFSRKILTINDAIAKLGLKTVKSLIFVAISKGILNKEVPGYKLIKGDLWKNSVTCAFYTKHLAETFNYKNPDLAFIAGLLRDIGKLIIDEYVGINYLDIIKIVNTSEIPFTRAEEMIVGYSHSQIGAEVLNSWNFPQVLVQSVKYHHDFTNARKYYGDKLEDFRLLALLHLGDALTCMLGNFLGADGLMYSIDEDALLLLSDSKSSTDLDFYIDQLLDLDSEISSMLEVLS